MLRIVILFVSFILPTEVLAEVRRPDPADFSDHTVQIYMGDGFGEPFSLASPGTNADPLLESWGVFLQSGATTAHTVVSVRDVRSILNPPNPPDYVYSIENGSPVGGDSAGIPLIIDFRQLLKRAALRLSGGPQPAVASLQAFDRGGRSLGTISGVTVRSQESRGELTEIEAVDGLISKIVIDYGASPFPERVEALVLDPFVPLVFETYVPQVGVGPVPEILSAQGGVYQSSIVILNPTNQDVEGVLQLKTGANLPLALPVKGQQQGSQFSFSLRPHDRVRFETEYAGTEVLSGYARITANGPVKANCLYHMVDAGNPFEAAVLSEEGKNVLVAFVEKDSNREINTGIALVNVGKDEATIRLFLIPSGVRRELTLKPGEHVAFFLDSFFDATEDFARALKIESTEPFVATVLRTWKGLASAALPVSSVQK